MEPEFFCTVVCHESATHLINQTGRYDVFLIDGGYFVLNEHGNWEEVFKFSDTRGVWVTVDGFSAAFTETE